MARFGERKEWMAATLRRALQPDESLVDHLLGMPPRVTAYGEGWGLTHRRLLVLDHAGGAALPLRVRSLESIPLGDMRTVTRSQSSRVSTITIDRRSDENISLSTFDHEAATLFDSRMNVMRQALTSTVSVAAELEGLARLRAVGVLSDEDCALARSRFLGAPASEQDLAARSLSQLHELHQRGALSESEFNMKKWEILARPPH